jgi:hypothetical protein
MEWRKQRKLPVVSRILGINFDNRLVGVPTFQITPPKLGAKLDHFAPNILFMLKSNTKGHR